MADGGQAAAATAEAVARRSYGKLVAFLAARTRDVAAAEDALAEAFAQALQGWPHSGIPEKPEAWLLSVARRRGVDAARRRATAQAATAHIRLIAEEAQAGLDANSLPDERLALMFACAHPAIDPNVRAPLILQSVLGFDAATIASAFLVAPSAMAQRLVRAKTRIREAGIPFAVPARDELDGRLAAVLGAVYAAYAEGWTDAAGTDTRRRNLADEALWLGRLTAALMPAEPESLGLLALMLFAESRRAARHDGGGYVPLAAQDMSLWDGAMIAEAEALLRAALQGDRLGRYQLEAAIQSAHAARRTTGSTDWSAVRGLYDALLALTGSPVVAINRAIVDAEISGAERALAELDELAGDQRLSAYQPYWAARAGLLARLGKSEAAAAYERAIGLERDPAVRHFLAQQRDALGGR